MCSPSKESWVMKGLVSVSHCKYLPLIINLGAGQAGGATWPRLISY